MKLTLAVLPGLLLAGCAMSTSMRSLALPTNGDKITVPNVFDLPRDQAIAALRAAGFRGEVSDASSTCGSVVDGRVIELGHVCTQHPSPDTVQGSRLPIELRVQHEDPRHGNAGQITEWYLMPRVVGMPLEAARTELARIGFRDSDRIKVMWVDAPGCKPLTVCETYPEPMLRHGIHSDTILTVARGSSVTPRTDSSAHAASQAGGPP